MFHWLCPQVEESPTEASGIRVRRSDADQNRCGCWWSPERATGSVKCRTRFCPLGRVTNLSYNSMGNVTSVTTMAGTAAAATTSRIYDRRFNELASVTDPLGDAVSANFDGDGNVESIVNSLGESAAFDLGLSPGIRPLRNTIWTKERGSSDEPKQSHGVADHHCAAG